LPTDQRLRTFSIAFDDPRYDESPFAEAVANHLKTDHQTFHVRPAACEDLPKIAAAFAEPFADSSALPTYYLSRETRRHVKVALSGDGGDELFGGYDRYRAMRISSLARALTTPLPWKLLSPLAKHLPGTHPKSRSARAKRLLASLQLPPARRYASYLRLFDNQTIQSLCASEDVKGIAANQRDLVEWLYPIGGILTDSQWKNALYVDKVFYLPWDLLTKLDRASMAHALEVRSPFMDHDLVRFAGTLSKSELVGGGPKRMLREAFAKDLPDFVFKRRKMGFAVPIGDWLRAELRPMLHDHLFSTDSFASTHFNLPVVRRLVEEHEQNRVDHSQRLYALLMLELWWRIHRSRA
jgi:asparagine synthase (glutamine-hydrolysing)